MRNPFFEITDRTVVFDGATGTLLQAAGLRPGELPETWALTRPDAIREVHRSYLEAGSDLIATDTFGANRLKFPEGGEFPLEGIVRAAVALAREEADAFSARTGKKPYVALDMGPTGRLLKPLGDLDFEGAVSVFSEVAKLGEKYGVDCILIETLNDSYELKAAVLAAKESTSLPVFATCVFDETGRLLTGADPLTVVSLLEGLGVDALGVNCGFGPDKLGGVVDDLLKYSSVPVIVKPNAGLPAVKNGKTEYDVPADTFAELLSEMVKKGARAVGGCCGTTPEYIRKLASAVAGIKPVEPPKKEYAAVCSGVRSFIIGSRPAVIGERINPTGKKKIKGALRAENYGEIFDEAVKQEERGADILDVNAGLPEIDEPAVLETLVTGLQGITSLPLCIDTSDPVAMERALRVYSGKALINSVNGKDEILDATLPLAAKYGGVVIGLTLDEDGIPDEPEGRLAIAKKIVERAAEYGIEKRNIVIDPLVLTVSADPLAAKRTLDSVSLIKKELGVAVSLGVSNVSFGLPGRDRLNSVFLAEALSRGLDAAIANPLSDTMMGVFTSHAALTGADPGFARYIAAEDGKEEKKAAPAAEMTLPAAIETGLSSRAAELTAALLETTPPLEVIDKYIIPALDRVGKAFEEKKLYLPQLLMSAEAAGASFDAVKKKMPRDAGASKGGIVLATVKGDIHDIGKNIVRTLLENFGFTVYDLGRDVPPERVLEAAIRHKVDLVGLSALMTTTVPAMEETIRLIHEKAPGVRVVVGGAVLTREYADAIGADKYCKDAMQTVDYAKEVYEGRRI
ncbi:MAG: homocysteine S-methyltransferase family protein [Clostridia bacterium]|nr:homocysteine S-methyltransferase family protein [Clostridia bacterium]